MEFAQTLIGLFATRIRLTRMFRINIGCESLIGLKVTACSFVLELDTPIPLLTEPFKCQLRCIGLTGAGAHAGEWKGVGSAANQHSLAGVRQGLIAGVSCNHVPSPP